MWHIHMAHVPSDSPLTLSMLPSVVVNKAVTLHPQFQLHLPALVPTHVNALDPTTTTPQPLYVKKTNTFHYMDDGVDGPHTKKAQEWLDHLLCNGYVPHTTTTTAMDIALPPLPVICGTTPSNTPIPFQPHGALTKANLDAMFLVQEMPNQRAVATLPPENASDTRWFYKVNGFGFHAMYVDGPHTIATHLSPDNDPRQFWSLMWSTNTATAIWLDTPVQLLLMSGGAATTTPICQDHGDFQLTWVWESQEKCVVTMATVPPNASKVITIYVTSHPSVFGYVTLARMAAAVPSVVISCAHHPSKQANMCMASVLYRHANEQHQQHQTPIRLNVNDVVSQLKLRYNYTTWSTQHKRYQIAAAIMQLF
jgi:hypothetical protein